MQNEIFGFLSGSVCDVSGPVCNTKEKSSLITGAGGREGPVLSAITGGSCQKVGESGQGGRCSIVFEFSQKARKMCSRL